MSYPAKRQGMGPLAEREIEVMARKMPSKPGQGPAQGGRGPGRDGIANVDPRRLVARASQLSREGRSTESVPLLEQAAKAGLGDASFMLAVYEANGILGPEDPRKTLRLARKAAEQGSAQGRRLLAVLTAMGRGTAADWPRAVGHLVAAAQGQGRSQGHPASIGQAGLLLAMDERADRGQARQLLRLAAQGNDAAAAGCLLAAALAGEDAIVGRDDAGLLMAVCASQGHPLTEWFRARKDQLPESVPGPEAGRISWPAIKKSLGALMPRPPEDTSVISTRPDVKTAPGLWSAAECAYVMAVAGPRLRPSLIQHPETGEDIADPYRTSRTATLWPVDLDLVVHMLNLRMALAAGLDPDRGEMLSVLHYRPGEEYRPHYDTLEHGKSGPNAELERSGQRVATVLVSLNADFEGGETVFPEADIQVKGRTGDGLIFRSVLDDGSVDEASLHAGLPIRSGEKWLASKWLREKPYQF